MLDTRYPVETPEGVEISLIPAGILPRSLAFAIDWLIRLGVILVSYFVLFQLGRFGFGLAAIIFFLLEWFYPVYFELTKNGVTPGKKLFGLRVLKIDGTPLSFSDSIIRNLLRAVDLFPLYLPGLLSMVLTDRFQRLGDLAAGTLVVHDQRVKALGQIDADAIRHITHELDMTERLAIVEFAERKNALTEDRQCELANILQGLVHESDQRAVKALSEVAKGYVS